MTIPTSKISDLAEEAIQIRASIDSHQSRISELNKRLATIEQQDMVEMMHEAGVDEFVYKGRKFALKLWVGGTWPKDPEKAAAATQYLEDIGADGILKTIVSADFGKEQHQIAQLVYELMGEHCDPKIKSAVHVMTLRSFARRRLAEGTSIDLEALGLIAGHTVNVRKLPRK